MQEEDGDAITNVSIVDVPGIDFGGIFGDMDIRGMVMVTVDRIHYHVATEVGDSTVVEKEVKRFESAMLGTQVHYVRVSVS